ncbi:MAG: MoxR family ATPase [Planctomycetota bacterium]|nr:MoxR family ATPase [Planctomycetota bacterium]
MAKRKSVEMEQLSKKDLLAVKKLNQGYRKLREELAKVIVGQERVLDEILIAIFSRGHAILEGVPGLAKTLMISTLAKTLSIAFHRIQFTPDLMPSDITGTEVIQEDRSTRTREFKFLEGPIFANVILADEINRTPPKTQAALLESMQERQVTVGGVRHALPAPFFVLATQNPIEQEGTYSLPEAQQDRFMFKIYVGYPTWDEEYDVVRLTTADQLGEVGEILSGKEIINLQAVVRKVPASQHVIEYAMRLVRKTRIDEEGAADFAKEWITWGAGPRASQYLVLGGKARAVLDGRYAVTTDDIKSVAHPVLRHRIITNFNAESEGMTADRIIDRLLEETDPKEAGALSDAKLQKVFKS